MGEYSISSVAARRYLLIACEVLQRESFHCAANAKALVDIEFCSQGYHDLPCNDMCRRLQGRVDAADAKGYDAILLGFALCSNGILGLKAGRTPIVIPRAHDCITLLLGSKERYAKLFAECPGTYYLSSGWMERDAKNLDDLRSYSVMSKLGLDKDFEQMKEQFGEENAKYITETLTGSFEKNYVAMAFIDTGLGDVESYRAVGREEARKRNLVFKEIRGDLSLIQAMLDGEWSEKDFLVLKNGETVARGDDEAIIAAAKS